MTTDNNSEISSHQHEHETSPLELDFTPTVVVYHDKCPDGFGAAYVCHKKFGDSVKYMPADYGAPLDIKKLKGERVLMVDVSFPRDVMEEVLKVTDRFLLLDHHKSQMDETGDMPHMHFDMDHSGAMLAWNFLFPDVPAPKMIAYIEDRDLWRFKLPETKIVLSVLDARPMTFQSWDLFSQALKTNPKIILETGNALAKQYESLVSKICEEAVPVTMNGYRGKMVNVPHIFASASGDYLYSQPDTDFALTWYQKKNGLYHCSWRSMNKSKNDGTALKCASLFGGAGHPNAASAKLDEKKFVALCKLIGAYQYTNTETKTKKRHASKP